MIATLITGAVIFAAGIVTGRFLPGRRRKGPEPGQPICGCSHNVSYHDLKTGRCHYVRVGPCLCRQYTGPTPLPEFYAPEIGVDRG